MNNSTNKDFDLVKAENLSIFYIRNRQFAKAFFISELMGYQFFFGNKSIIDCKLGLSKRYHKRTVESVLSDLGYKIVSFYNQTNYEYCGTKKHSFSVLTFTTAEGS